MTSTTAPATSITTVTLEVTDVGAGQRFYAEFGVDAYIHLRESSETTSGFRGFTLALTVSQPATVDAFLDAATTAGAQVIKPAAKSLWGYGGVVQAPDGTIWKVATSAKKNTGPATRDIDEVVLLIGVDDVKATKKFYVERGLTVGRSFGGKYAEFTSDPSSPVKLALYKRRGLARDLGVSVDGTGSHRIVIGSNASDFVDPNGFVWESTDR